MISKLILDGIFAKRSLRDASGRYIFFPLQRRRNGYLLSKDSERRLALAFAGVMCLSFVLLFLGAYFFGLWGPLFGLISIAIIYSVVMHQILRREPRVPCPRPILTQTEQIQRMGEGIGIIGGLLLLVANLALLVANLKGVAVYVSTPLTLVAVAGVGLFTICLVYVVLGLLAALKASKRKKHDSKESRGSSGATDRDTG